MVTIPAELSRLPLVSTHHWVGAATVGIGVALALVALFRRSAATLSRKRQERAASQRAEVATRRFVRR